MCDDHGEKRAFERLAMNLKKKYLREGERVEAVFVESKESIKRMCFLVVTGCVMLINITKVIG